MKYIKLNFITGLLFGIIVLSMFGCNKSSQHQILTVFFDGVEPINEVAKVGEDSTSTDGTVNIKSTKQILPANIQYYLHSPFEDRSCESCHYTMGSNRLNQPQPQLCYDCHDDFQEEYTELHGPVASGNCTACHNPHKSQNEKLLVVEIEKLCVYCHETGDVSNNQSHKDLGSVNCISCHNSHGGETLNMLKPGVKTES